MYVEVNNDWSNWYIELYENYPCNSKEELLKKEGEVIRLIGSLNSRIAGRTEKEYKKDNAEKNKEYQKQYRIEYANKKQESNKQYRIKNVDKIKQYLIDNAEKIKEQQKQYNIKNAERLKEQRRLRYLKDKEKKLSI